MAALELPPSGSIWNMSAPVNFISYQNPVYRNFATLYPSQDLTDDLADTETEQNILKNFFYETKELDPVKAKRVFQKSLQQIVQKEIDSRFKPENWRATRYSDGSWGVLYAAETEETSLQEAVYHCKLFYKEELAVQKEITLDRRVVCLRVHSTKAIEVLKLSLVNKAFLISTNKSGYPYCQNLAHKLISKGAELLRTPSARLDKGFCIPIFDTQVIKKDEGHLKYLKLVMTKKGCEVLATSQFIAF